jgi:hypothetical protein
MNTNFIRNLVYKKKLVISHQKEKIPGIRLEPCKDPSQPRVIIYMKCRLGNQIFQAWIAQKICDILNRKLHVVMIPTTEDCNIYTCGLFDIPIYESIEYVNNSDDVLPSPHEVDPFCQLFDYTNIHENDVIVDVHAECWYLLSQYEEYIRSFYKLNCSIKKEDRIIVHLRLGDVAHKMSKNTNYITYVVNTIYSILQQQKRTIPIYLLSEDPEHVYSKQLIDTINYNLHTNVVSINNHCPLKDFCEIMASSFIIMTNSTFSYLAAFLADPTSTQVYAGISPLQPCAHHRNFPLFERGCPANFHISNIDNVMNIVPIHYRTPTMINENDSTSIITDIAILTITSNGYIDITKNFVASLEKHWSSCKTVIIVCLDSISFQTISNIYSDVSYIKPIFYCDLQEHSELAIYGTKHFNHIMFKKLDVIRQMLLRVSEHIIYVDSDVVFINDPINSQLFQKIPDNIDMVFQCDEYRKSCNKSNNNQCLNLCAGVMMVKSTLRTQKLLDHRSFINNKVIECCIAGDQTYINVLRSHIEYDVLPHRQYPNGSWLHDIHPEAILVHYNWMLGFDKINKMKQNKHWFL